MGVRIHSNMEADFAKFLNNKERKLYAALAAAMIGIVHDAEWNAKANTASSGRVLTGAMLNAIQSKVEFQARKVVGEVGFIGDQAEYYIYQTVTGFTHWLGGQRIDPTGALADAAVQAGKDAEAAIEAAIRSVA